MSDEGVDRDLFETVCFERDIAEARLRSLQAALEGEVGRLRRDARLGTPEQAEYRTITADRLEQILTEREGER